jgi:hypothetical protein
MKAPNGFCPDHGIEIFDYCILCLKEREEQKKPLAPDQTFATVPLPLRILAIAEGYVMARFKGCHPFVETMEKFEKRLEIAKILSPNNTYIQ